ncbi:MFS transporter [Marinomonas sp.]|nr:MFS transporter [Marinomonas sp.]
MSSRDQLSRWLLLSCLIILGIGQSFIFTSLPPIGREIGLSDVRISTLITAGAITFVIAAFFWGGLINRIGRVRSVIFGMTSYAMTIAATGWVLQKALSHQLTAEQTYYWTFVLRVLFALGIAGIMPSIQTYLIAHSDIANRSSSIAMIGASFSIGMIMGPAFASFASGLGLTAPFYIIGLLAGVAGMLVLVLVIDTKHVRQRVKQMKIRWLKEPVLPFFAMSVFCILAITGVQQIMSFLIQDRFHLDVAETTHLLGFVMMTMSGFSILVQMFLVPRFQIGVVTLIFTGVSVGLIAMLCFIIFDTYLSILIAMGLFGTGMGFLFPGVITAQTLLVKDDQQSRLASMNASMQGLGAALGPVALASLYQIGEYAPFFALIAGMLLLCITFVYCRSKLGYQF